jgi:subfamily B ATP-binding cassette protein MsbA
VTLRYRAAQAPALDRIDLELRAGETVALVGPSGAGKTTLVNLLPRFLEPTVGNAAPRRPCPRRLERRLR